MSTTIRNVLHALAAALIIAFAVGSVASYSGSTRDRTLAVRSVKNALAALNASGVDPQTAMRRYRDELIEANDRLRHALMDYPGDTASIQRLAAVLWELGETAGQTDQDAVSALVAVASARTPHLPETQIELGELLYRIGRVPEASERFVDALALAPSQTRRVVEMMLSFGSSPIEIGETLSPTPQLLQSLETVFLNGGLDEEFMSLVDGALDTWPAELLSMYGDICLRTGNCDRLLERLRKPFGSASPRVEALRLVQRGRAFARLADPRAALVEANHARSLAPGDPDILEALGVIAIEGGDSVMALEDLQKALAQLTLSEHSALARGRVYRKLGQAEELAGEPERAIDAYARAIRLNPDETFARTRLAQMEAAAGFHPQIN